VFYDETGFSFLAPLARSWAPRGQRPVLRRVTSQRRALSTAIGLTLSGKIYKRHFATAIDSDRVLIALQHIGRRLKGNWIRLWDRAQIHRSNKVKAYLAQHPEIIVEWLPAYAPELNPEEYCHGNVKEQLRNVTPASREELRSMVDGGFARLRKRPDLILGFIHHAGLSVKQLWLN
jgi:transposase